MKFGTFVRIVNIIILLGICLIFFPLVSHAQSVQYTPPEIAEMVATHANEEGVDPKIALYITWKESGWNSNAQGDFSTTTMAYTSFGVAQIHLSAHPEISKEQALDPIFSINYLINNLVEGKCKMWSTCPL